MSFAQAKSKLDPQKLLAASDATYYFPTTVGLTDLAVDLVIPQLEAFPGAKQVRITYYYAANGKQQFEVTELPDRMSALRGEILNLVSALAEYIVPLPSATAFKGFKVQAQRVSREIMGIKEKNFYQLIGTNTNEQAPVKEYRVLLDKHGLAYELENVLKGGDRILARVMNVRTGEKWQVARVTTRLMGRSGPQWKIEEISYRPAEGFSLPAEVKTQYRDNTNKPITGLADVTIRFENYRINKDIAAAFFAAKTPAATPTLTTPGIEPK
ncbi:MAG: hypothetical protein ACYC7E_13000 [Armatimonadota bacterium]